VESFRFGNQCYRWYFHRKICVLSDRDMQPKTYSLRQVFIC
jgi:hypothetical protein